MKTAAVAIALLMGGAAFAQSTTTHSTHTTAEPHLDADARAGVQTDGDVNVGADVDLDTQTTTTTTTTTNHSTMSHSTMAHSTTMASTQVVQPGNMNPERDARGIPVISAPAMVPGGWNGTMGSAMGGPLVDPATGEAVGSDATYPACTATVTDNCVQAYTRR